VAGGEDELSDQLYVGGSGKWQAIEDDKNNTSGQLHVLYSNRSAAYLR